MSSALQSQQYLSRIAETLYKFQQNGTLCDIVIQIQGSEITAHSVVLAAASPNLRELLPSRNTTLESGLVKKPVIQLEGYDLGVARLWLEFLYTGRCSEQPKSVKQLTDMMSLCDALQMPKPEWETNSINFTDLRQETDTGCSLADEGDSTITKNVNHCIAEAEESNKPVSVTVPELNICDDGLLRELSFVVKQEEAITEERTELMFSLCQASETSRQLLMVNGEMNQPVTCALVKVESTNSFPEKKVCRKRGRTQEGKSCQGTSNQKPCKMLIRNGTSIERVKPTIALPSELHSMLSENSTEKNGGSGTDSNSITVALPSFSHNPVDKPLFRGNTLKCKSCGSTRFIDVRKDRSGGTQNFPLSYKCLECGDQILTLDGLELERQQRKNAVKSSQRNIHTCELCSRAFGTHSGLFGHLAKHSLLSFTEVTCGICKSSFSSTSDFLNHVVIFGGSNRNQRSAGSSGLKLPELNLETSRETGFVNRNGTVGEPPFAKCEVTTSHDLKMGSHKCLICMEVFWTHASLYRHRSKHEFLHIFDGPLPTCGICQTAFADISQLQGHVTSKAGLAVFSKDDEKPEVSTEKLVMTTRKVFECNHCGRSFGNKGGLQSHVNMHLDGRPHKCLSCGDSFRFSKHLSSHARMYHNVFICSKCGLDCSCTVEEAKALETADKQLKATNKHHSCPECQKIFCTRKGLLNHKLVHDNTKNFICEICGLRFRRPDRLASHKFMHVSRPYPCQFCHKYFLNAVRLEEHTRTHTGESPLVCSHCGQHFKARSALRVHLVRKHSTLHRLKVVTNKCNLCGRQFSSKAYLMLHIKWHSGKFRVYRCHVCNRGFYDPYALRKHMVVHAELRERPFLCYICGKGFTTRGNLKTHAASHKNEKLFFCSCCNKGFKFKSNLNKHLKTHQNPVGCTDILSNTDDYTKVDDDLEYICVEEVVDNTD